MRPVQEPGIRQRPSRCVQDRSNARCIFLATCFQSCLGGAVTVTWGPQQNTWTPWRHSIRMPASFTTAPHLTRWDFREAGEFVRRHRQRFAADILQGRYELRLQEDPLHLRCKLFDDRTGSLGGCGTTLPSDFCKARDRFADDGRSAHRRAAAASFRSARTSRPRDRPACVFILSIARSRLLPIAPPFRGGAAIGSASW